MEVFRAGRLTRHARAAAFAVVSALTLVAPATADDGGGTLSVSPIRITIDQADRAQTATVYNGGEQPMDIAVDAYGWTQSPGIPLGLNESRDLLVYPRLLHVDAHGQRIVKVGIVDGLGTNERAYRLSFTQLPAGSGEGPEPPHAVTFRMRITMPVFIAPAVPAAARLSIERADVQAHAIRIWLRNTGTIHAIVPALDVDANDAAGTSIAREHVAGWYVLAGAEQSFSVQSNAARCARIARLNVSVRLDSGATISQVIVPSSECGR